MESLSWLCFCFFLASAGFVGLAAYGKFLQMKERSAYGDQPHQHRPPYRDVTMQYPMQQPMPPAHRPPQFNDPSFQLGYNIGLSHVREWQRRNQQK